MKDGSNTKEGYTYHELPGSGIPAQRLGLEERVKFILSKIDVKEKSILDLGCNVGGVSYLIAKEGGYVNGIDYDENAIKIGRDFLIDKELKGNVFLRCEEINPIWFESLPKYDIVLWLSQWQWLVKQYGLLRGFDALYEISKRAKILVFETAANDGRAKIEGASQDEIYQWLVMNTGYTKIERYQKDDNNWHKRDLFICSEPKFEWRRHRNTIIKRISRNIVEKKNDIGGLVNMDIRDISFLKELTNSSITPKFIESNNNHYQMTYGGMPIKELREEDIQLILKTLRERKIIHRDIIPSNLLWNGKNVVLIDFAWAIHEGEILEPPKNIGEKYRSPNGFDDEYSLRKIKEELNAH